MKKSAEDRLIDFLKANPSRFASAELQRMTWVNKNGTAASPRSVVRRLEENTYHEVSTTQHKQNLDGVLLVSYENGNAYYQIKEGHEKKEFVAYTRHPLTGERITTAEYALL